jgi:hypothetical protein
VISPPLLCEACKKSGISKLPRKILFHILSQKY